MRKQDVFDRVTKQTGLDAEASRSILEAFFEVVRRSLIGGEPIYVRTFGSFILQPRARKVARNINQNTAHIVEARVVPAFKPSREFTNQVRVQQIPVEPEKAKRKPTKKGQ
jgi:DNA-binding protein HU-beta